jgi:lipopolysaccharide heptosyltransferase I
VNAAALRSHPFERILLVKLSAFGDVVNTLPVLAKLRARYPAARIDWLITPENAEVVRYHPALSGVVLFQRRDYTRFGRRWSATVGLLRLLAQIRRARYDLVVDVHGQFRSALFIAASGAPVRLGFDRPRRDVAADRFKGVCAHGWNGAREGSWLAYTHRIPVPTLDVHAIDRYLWLGRPLGFDDGPPDLRVYWPAAAEEKADALLGRHGLRGRPFAVVVPTTIWPTKHWHVEGFAGVGRYLLQRGLGVVVAGAPKDRARCAEVAAACPGACDLAGQTTLAEFAALLNRAAVAVTNDSGSMHLAVALGRPVVSVFGPTDPLRIGPYGRRDAVVWAGVPCAPCYFKSLSQCPHDHACMRQVTAGMVIERVEAVLAGETPSRLRLGQQAG